MSTSILHQAHTRGSADHGWLQSHHSFSFAEFYDPERTHFGALRVLNDDTVAPGMGFGMHPHSNMEIISIPLEGDLEHKDSMGNVAVIKNGDVQVMSAGTGIKHSEYNKSKEYPVKFLQIWIIPDKAGVPPRYDQLTLDKNHRHNKLQMIISPHKEEGALWIHQKAWLHLSSMDTGVDINYTLKQKNNGLYVFVLNGTIQVQDQTLETRDALGLWDLDEISLSSKSNSELLLIEVPMRF